MIGTGVFSTRESLFCVITSSTSSGIPLSWIYSHGSGLGGLELDILGYRLRLRWW